MTPKEKADDLIYKFSTSFKVFDELKGWIIHVDSSKAKGHALVAVKQILDNDLNSKVYHYWKEVEEIIESL